MTCINYQYAVKVIQGGINVSSHTQPIGPGIYFTSVNVHNPWRHEVKYAVKLAISGPHGRPGDVFPFHLHQLGPDEATEYDHLDFMPNPPSFLESYFVIESEEELDVVGVYTGAAVQDKHLGAMHMERVPARVIPRCKDLKMDISTGVAQWQITAVPVIGSFLNTGPAPVSSPVHSNWALPPNNNVKWVGTPGNVSTAEGEYKYELRFRLCWTFKDAKIDFMLWADNSAKVYLNADPTPIGAASTFLQGQGSPVSATIGFQPGVNIIKVVVTNDAGGTVNPSGMMLSGTLSANAADCDS